MTRRAARVGLVLAAWSQPWSFVGAVRSVRLWLTYQVIVITTSTIVPIESRPICCSDFESAKAFWTDAVNEDFC